MQTITNRQAPWPAENTSGARSDSATRQPYQSFPVASIPAVIAAVIAERRAKRAETDERLGRVRNAQTDRIRIAVALGEMSSRRCRRDREPSYDYEVELPELTDLPWSRCREALAWLLARGILQTADSSTIAFAENIRQIDPDLAVGLEAFVRKFAGFRRSITLPRNESRRLAKESSWILIAEDLLYWARAHWVRDGKVSIREVHLTKQERRDVLGFSSDSYHKIARDRAPKVRESTLEKCANLPSKSAQDRVEKCAGAQSPYKERAPDKNLPTGLKEPEQTLQAVTGFSKEGSGEDGPDLDRITKQDLRNRDRLAELIDQAERRGWGDGSECWRANARAAAAHALRKGSDPPALWRSNVRNGRFYASGADEAAIATPAARERPTSPDPSPRDEGLTIPQILETIAELRKPGHVGGFARLKIGSWLKEPSFPRELRSKAVAALAQAAP